MSINIISVNNKITELQKSAKAVLSYLTKSQKRLPEMSIHDCNYYTVWLEEFMSLNTIANCIPLLEDPDANQKRT